VQTGPKGIPFLVTHDGRTIRYPDPVIKVNDTIQLDIATSKIMDSIKFDSGEQDSFIMSLQYTDLFISASPPFTLLFFFF
jgi:ribosomal protein S4E